MTFSEKWASNHIKSMLCVAHSHAEHYKGLKCLKLVVGAQQFASDFMGISLMWLYQQAKAWVEKGLKLKQIDIKGWGQSSIQEHPKSWLRVILHEGKTPEEKAEEVMKYKLNKVWFPGLMREYMPTLPTMVFHINGLHWATSSLWGFLCYLSSHRLTDKAGDIHTLPWHSKCSTSNSVVPHPCILQTWGPGTCHIRPWLWVHIALLLLLRQTPLNETTLHIRLPPGRGQTDGAC